MVSERCKMGDFKALAVATDIQPAASPCGMCRQALREFCDVSGAGFQGVRWRPGQGVASLQQEDGQARNRGLLISKNDTDEDFAPAVDAHLYVRQE